MAVTKKKRRGRPESNNPADERLPMVRVTKQQLDAYKSASERSGKAFSAWVRNALDRAVKRA